MHLALLLASRIAISEYALYAAESFKRRVKRREEKKRLDSRVHAVVLLSARCTGERERERERESARGKKSQGCREHFEIIEPIFMIYHSQPSRSVECSARVRSSHKRCILDSRFSALGSRLSRVVAQLWQRHSMFFASDHYSQPMQIDTNSLDYLRVN